MTELIYGIYVVKSMLNQNPNQILKMYIICKPRNSKLDLIFYQAKRMNLNIQECSRRWLSIKVKGVVHQGIVAKIKNMSYLKEEYLLNFLETCSSNIIPFLLILDRITDPHNLGACLRSAAAAGVHMVIVPRDHSVYVNATVRKVSSGSSDYVPVVKVINLSRTLKLLRQYGIWVVGTVVQSKRIIFDTKLLGPLAFVMGSEETGIRYGIKKSCNELISIPMSKSVVSLNVSVATGICLFEALRQRQCYI